jgi:hypothetical protein
MRWWGGTLLLVLLTFPLVRNASAASSSPQAQNRVQVTPAQNREQRQTASPTPNAAVTRNQPEPKSTQSTASQNKTNTQEELSTYDVLSLIAQYLIFAATVIYAIVALRQLWAIHRQSDIAAEATETAKKSVEIARLSLVADRPYMIVLDAEFREHRSEKSVFMESHIHVRNCGKSPAIIDELVAFLGVVANFPSVGDFSKCGTGIISEPAYSAGEKMKDYVANFVVSIAARESADAGGENHVVLYGRYRYHDVFGNHYETAFLYWLFSDTFMCDEKYTYYT